MAGDIVSTATQGTVIAGRFRLTRLLGQGAMGIVWAAFDDAAGKMVALKLLARPEPELRIRLQREARACGQLQHPNVIEVIEVLDTEAGEPVLVMPLLTGETLAERLERKRRLDPSEAARIGRDIARGLAAAHAQQIIHRDLKPANIFLHVEEEGGDFVVKILDFGVAKNLGHTDGHRTVAGGQVGSAFYMSPEQVRSQAADPRADLWSLGVILFEMLTGVRPFQGETQEVMSSILSGEIPKVSRHQRNIDPALVTIVSRCLTRELPQRMASAGELVGALDVYLASAPDAAFRPSSFPSAPLDATPPPELRASRAVPPSAPRVPVIHDDEGEDVTVRVGAQHLAPTFGAPPLPTAQDVSDNSPARLPTGGYGAFSAAQPAPLPSGSYAAFNAPPSAPLPSGSYAAFAVPPSTPLPASSNGAVGAPPAERMSTGAYGAYQSAPPGFNVAAATEKLDRASLQPASKPGAVAAQKVTFRGTLMMGPAENPASALPLPPMSGTSTSQAGPAPSASQPGVSQSRPSSLLPTPSSGRPGDSFGAAISQQAMLEESAIKTRSRTIVLGSILFASVCVAVGLYAALSAKPSPASATPGLVTEAPVLPAPPVSVAPVVSEVVPVVEPPQVVPSAVPSAASSAAPAASGGVALSQTPASTAAGATPVAAKPAPASVPSPTCPAKPRTKADCAPCTAFAKRLCEEQLSPKAMIPETPF